MGRHPAMMTSRHVRLAHMAVIQTCILGGVFAAFMSFPLAAMADRPADIHLIAKSDARRLFAMSKQRWSQTIRHAAASGMASPLRQERSRSLGMTVLAQSGTVSTLLRYDTGDARPSAILLVLAYASAEAPRFTDASARKIVALMKSQMSPEFYVIGETDRIGDRFALFVFITQRKTAPLRWPAGARKSMSVDPPATGRTAHMQMVQDEDGE
jgi:hypothetical protein